jgi:hypothetical protein
LYDSNSNDFTYTLGVDSGVKSQMDAFNPDPGNAALGGAPGYQTPLPTTGLSQQIFTGFNNIKSSIGSFFSDFVGLKLP